MGNNVSIKDIAKMAGVSIATVSRVINKNGKVAKETEEKILQIMKENNYVPNLLAKGAVSVAFSACKKGNDMNIQTEIKPCLADYPDALTVDEVIAILRVSRKTVYELIKDGRIKAVKVGRSHRIAKENLIEFLNPAAAHSNPGCVLSDNNREKVWTCEQQCGMLCVAQTA